MATSDVTPKSVAPFIILAVVLMAVFLGTLALIVTLAFGVSFLQAFAGITVAYALLASTRGTIRRT